MSGVDIIIELVRDGSITPAQGTDLFELRREMRRAYARREAWRAVRDVVTLGAVRRWIRGMR